MQCLTLRQNIWKVEPTKMHDLHKEIFLYDDLTLLPCVNSKKVCDRRTS